MELRRAKTAVTFVAFSLKSKMVFRTYIFPVCSHNNQFKNLSIFDKKAVLP
jgi:hypothetical protein